jgi:Fe-S-cluster-containing dehydrogenase component
MSAPRYAMAVDTRTCVGCSACVIGCKEENDVPAGYSRDWVVTETRGRFPDLSMVLRSERCNHCADAPCVRACPTGSSHYGPGSTVQVNRQKCSGCKACISACPDSARYVDPRSGTVDKCSFCIHRIEAGKATTSCQEICPTGSIIFGDLNDPASEIGKALATREHAALLADAGTAPSHHYLK